MVARQVALHLKEPIAENRSVGSVEGWGAE